MDKLGAWAWGRRAGLVALLTAVVALGPSALGAKAFTRALTDSVWFSGSAQQNARWVQRTTATGAGLVLLEVDWLSIEPTAPPPGTADPTNPNGPQYSFANLDARVREFKGTGLKVAFLLTDAPSWAEAPGGPADLEARGAWRPNATAFGQAATALARRYSGSYPDPRNPGHDLPRVRYYQAWAEANFSVHLAPQWVHSGGTWVPAAPAYYRNMLNAFYAGVKSVHSDDVVITTGFGPYGDLAPGACTGPDAPQLGNGCRMAPAMFARELLCLHGQGLTPESCPDPAHFDALAMDPYEVGGPTTRAATPDNISAPDLGKLTKILNKAGRLGRDLPRGHKQLWVTEFSYDSKPPNPTAPSLALQARWLAQTFYIFWKEGVSTAVWYLASDQAATYSPLNYYSGVYFFDGRPKPALEAFRFPLVVASSGQSAIVWAISPRTGSLAVQHQAGRTWKTLLHVHVSAGNVFVHKISGKLHGKFRGVVGGETSLVWTY